MKDSLKCPRCRQALARPKSSDCPVCSRLIRIAEKTCCRFILEKNKLDFSEVKGLLGNWPLSVQQEFVRAIAIFKIKNNKDAVSSLSGGR